MYPETVEHLSIEHELSRISDLNLGEQFFLFFFLI